MWQIAVSTVLIVVVISVVLLITSLYSKRFFPMLLIFVCLHLSISLEMFFQYAVFDSHICYGYFPLNFNICGSTIPYSLIPCTVIHPIWFIHFILEQNQGTFSNFTADCGSPLVEALAGYLYLPHYPSVMPGVFICEWRFHVDGKRVSF